MEAMTAVVKDLDNNIKYVIGKEFTIMSQGHAIIGILESSKCIKLPNNEYEVVIADFIPTVELSNELVGVETAYRINREERTITNPDGVTLLIPHMDSVTLYDLIHILDLFNK